MKLQNQLNIAFTMVLLVILTVTGFVVYSLILDLLIQDEQRQLAQKGELLVNVLNEEYQTVFEFSEFLQEQDLQLLCMIADRTKFGFQPCLTKMHKVFSLIMIFRITRGNYGNIKMINM